MEETAAETVAGSVTSKGWWWGKDMGGPGAGNPRVR